MRALRRAWRRRHAGDDGIGMIMVIGVSVMVMALAATAVAYAVNGIAQSRNRTSFETSLASAEQGIDRTLAELQQSFDSFNRDYPVPSQPDAFEPSPWCVGDPVSYPSAPADGAGGVFSTEQAERGWARSHLETIRTRPGCIQSGPEGEYVVLKPLSPLVNGLYPKSGKVYSLAAVPSFADANAKLRLVKTEYIFMPYRPTHAVLTSGSVSIAASTTIQAAYGVDPALASVHSNATVTGMGNPTVTGPVTSTGTSSFTSNKFAVGGAVAQKASQRIPRVSARSFYFQAAASDPTAMSDWYDLCPDGNVRPYSSNGPCTATTSIGNATTNQVRGWSYNATSRLWTAHRQTLMSGTYYALEANIENDGGVAEIPRLSLIAEALNPNDCTAKRYGNISWSRYTLRAPAFKNLWMYADADIQTHSNFTAGSGITAPPVISGMFVAGDQITMNTSSQGAVGSVLSANQCATPPSLPVGLTTTSEIQNPTVYYDPNSDAPFTSIITTSLWLDYRNG